MSGSKSAGRLQTQVAARGLSHATLIEGPKGSKKGALARQMAALACCEGQEPRPCGVCVHCLKIEKGIHPDVCVHLPEKGSTISVELVRALRADASVLPNEARCKLHIIERADCMTTAAQNAFLKLLEEPPAFCHFILCASDRRALLAPVRSRLAVHSVAPLGPQALRAALADEGADLREGALLELALALSGGGVLAAKEVLDDPFYGEALDFCLDFFRRLIGRSRSAFFEMEAGFIKRKGQEAALCTLLCLLIREALCAKAGLPLRLAAQAETSAALAAACTGAQLCRLEAGFLRYTSHLERHANAGLSAMRLLNDCWEETH